MKKHDENKCLRSIWRIGRVGGKTIEIPKNAIVGIHLWGKIDYLVHYCGYTLIRTHPQPITIVTEDYNTTKKQIKQNKKIEQAKQVKQNKINKRNLKDS